MRTDVLDLQTFYRSRVGAVAHAMVARRLAAIWPDVAGLDVMGFGYARPWADTLSQSQEGRAPRRVVLAMPAAQGVESWPEGARNAAVLVDETRLPFAEAMFDRVLVIHALEEADAVRPLLRELWRVMAPEARMVIVCANRAGLWALAGNTPFGAGRSWSRGQLSTLLLESMFQPTAWTRAAWAPPMKLFTGLADTVEALGEKTLPRFGGILMVEAIKRLYAVTPRSGRVLVARAPAAVGSQRNP
jgi:SAM-dependent methyltransferase